MLKLIDIKKAFNNRPILKGVNATVNDGQMAALIGANGAGKSTIFNIITGETKPDSGVIVLDGQEILALKPTALAKHFALLRQDPKTVTAANLTVFENMVLAVLKNRSASVKKALSSTNKEIILKHLVDLGINTGLLDQKMGNLSGGQRQMLAFAMATIYRPKLLLLDEPTAALDENATEQMMTLVKRFISQWQIPAVMICHDKDLVERFMDQKYELSDGIFK
jgi:putative ABC transport system ATP-binding protein